MVLQATRWHARYVVTTRRGVATRSGVGPSAGTRGFVVPMRARSMVVGCSVRPARVRSSPPPDARPGATGARHAGGDHAADTARAGIVRCWIVAGGWIRAPGCQSPAAACVVGRIGSRGRPGSPPASAWSGRRPGSRPGRRTGSRPMALAQLDVRGQLRHLVRLRGHAQGTRCLQLRFEDVDLLSGARTGPGSPLANQQLPSAGAGRGAGAVPADLPPGRRPSYVTPVQPMYADRSSQRQLRCAFRT